MANMTGRRMTAEIDGDFVVFLIGARFNSFHLVKTVLDLGGRRGMKHMLDYLVAHPEKGLLGYQMGLPTIVQYWRSFDHLEAFANDTGDPHVAAWRNYWKRVGQSTRTGIWHETYLVRPASMRRSTGTCRRSGWARRAAWSRWPGPRPRGTASGPPRAGQPPPRADGRRRGHDRRGRRRPARGTALEEQRNGEWRYLEFLQVTSLITAEIFMREIPGGMRAR